MNWKKISEKVIFKGWRDIIEKKFSLPTGKEAAFDILRTADYVTIAAFTEHQEVILVKQFRPGPEVALTSFPEGALEKGEAPEIAATRELLEETGYQADSITYLKSFKSAYTTQKQICVLATNCKKVNQQNLDETEFIEVILIPIEKFRNYLTNPTDDSFTNVDAAFLALDAMGML